MAEPAALPAAAVAAAAAAPLTERALAAATPASACNAGSGPVPKASPNRCSCCRKKVGLLGFTCKCGLLLCAAHRYAEAHDCSHDYASEGRARLAAANPLVQAAKVQKI